MMPIVTRRVGALATPGAILRNERLAAGRRHKQAKAGQDGVEVDRPLRQAVLAEAGLAASTFRLVIGSVGKGL